MAFVPRIVTTKTRALASALAVTTAGAIAWFGYRTFTAYRVAQETSQLAEVLALKPTSHVADVGAGNAAFSIELASRFVPQGRVFATELEEESVAKIRERASAAGLQHVTAVQAVEESTNLPPGCCDAVFLRGVYHHVTKPADTNRTMHDALRPNGRLAIIDFEPSWFLSTFVPVGDVPANRGGHGIPPMVVVAELERAGFRLIERIDAWTRGQYCLVFEKDVTPYSSD